MEIKLRSYDKRLNSTKVPSYNLTEWDSFQCYLRSPTSILTPVVILENVSQEQNAMITSYNYALINDFDGRYYFIKDIVSNNGLWTLYLDIDVLGTYEFDISNSTQYILRSTYFGNSYIIDGIYPTTLDERIYIDYDYERTADNYSRNVLDVSQRVVYRREFENGKLINEGKAWSYDTTYFNQPINSGGFIVGLLSDNGTGVTYYGMTRSVLVDFLNKVVMLVPSATSDLESGTARLLFNALQYIVSIKWFPALPTIVNQSWVTTINVGGNPITFDNYRVFDISENPIEEFYFDIDIPKHPKTLPSSDFYQQFDFLNASPYRQANLYFQPFGNIPIEVSRFSRGDHTLRVNWAIDFTTGSVVLKLYTGDNELIYTTSSDIGVTLPVSNVTIQDTTFKGIIGGYLALKSFNSKFTTSETLPYMTQAYNAEQLSWREIAERGHGNVDQMYDWTGKINTDIVEKAVDFGVDAIASLFGQVNTLGNTESFLGYYDVPFVYAWFQDIVQPDRYKFGIPRNKNGLLNDFKGNNSYIKCANANVNFTSAITSIERSKVISYLNSGFYME